MNMRRLMAAGLLMACFTSGSAWAQTAVEGRVDRLEREMRAVQRKVFPGGAGQLVEPQITAPTNQSAPGSPASGVVSDLTARVSALESQVTTMTGQVEQMQFKLRQLEDAFNAYKRSTDARVGGLENPQAAATGDTSPAPRPSTGTKPAAPAANTGRATQVAAIERPKSDDAGEDAYLYGYRLWEAKLYPEAQAQLRATVQKYPKHRRASYAQNLLGRAYLDEGKPSQAAIAFYENYQKMPDGDRAPDSLFFLAQALVKLKKPATEVCKVYAELTQVYGDKLSEQRKTDIAAGRAAQKCK